jgi:hypothetical protein
MAEEKKTNLTWLWIVIALILGFLICFALFPRTVEKTVTVTETKEVPVEKLVYVNSTTEVEVPLDVKGVYLDPAVDELFIYLEDEDLTDCGGESYDIDQIKISRVYDDWKVDFDKEDYTVDYQIKLKYLDTDTEEKCYLTLTPSVYYEEGEDPVVTL